MPYIPHLDKPADLQEIELHMHELMTFHKFNRWDMGRLDFWLDNRPDQIYEAIQRLKGFFADRGTPHDLLFIDQVFEELAQWSNGGYWSLMDLNKWLETYPDKIFDATMRLESMLEEMFPPLEHSIFEGGEDGGVPTHYHQTA